MRSTRAVFSAVFSAVFRRRMARQREGEGASSEGPGRGRYVRCGAVVDDRARET